MASNDIEYSLGMNLGPLEQAGKAVGKWGEDTAKVLNRKFGAADLFKGFLQGVGIASVEQIAEKLVAPFKESAESAKSIADYTEQTAASLERQLKARQDDAAQLASMQKNAKRAADELNDALNKPATQKFFGLIERGSALDKLFGFSRREDATKVQAVAEATVKATVEEEKAKAKAVENSDKVLEQQVKNQLVRADFVAKNREQLELEAKALSGRILPAEKARLDLLHLQGKQQEVNARIGAILEKFPEQRTEQEKQTLATLMNQRTTLEKQIDAKKALIDATKEQVAAEGTVTKAIESNLAAWENFVGTINSVGRGDNQLSDAELAKKINNLNKDLAGRAAGASSTYQGASGFMNYDVLGESQKGSLAQALAEQRLRDQVRRNAQTFGAERAFQMFGGTQERFNQILNGRDTAESTGYLREIRDSFKKGIVLVQTGSASGG